MVFLLLGAVVNVGVAWGCASGALVPSKPTATSYRVFGHFSWEVNVSRSIGAERVMSLRASGLGRPHEEQMKMQFGPEPATIAPRWSRLDLSAAFDPTLVDMEFLWEDARGWPMLSMRSAGTTTETSLEYTSEVFTGLELTSASGQRGLYFPRVLPVQAIFPGFAINTLFYATILWLLFALPFTLRRWRRINRGLCATCAYPVGASEVCTECGAALLTRSHKSRARP